MTVPPVRFEYEDMVAVHAIAEAVSHGLFALQSNRVIQFPGAPDEGWTVEQIHDRVVPAVDAVISSLESIAARERESHKNRR